MTGSLACGVLALWCGCGDGPRTVDPAGMPASVDVAQLRGDRVSQTPCTFAHEVDRGMPSGSGVVRLWLECPPTDGVLLVGFVEVASVPVVESARTGDLPTRTRSAAYATPGRRSSGRVTCGMGRSPRTLGPHVIRIDAMRKTRRAT